MDKWQDYYRILQVHNEAEKIVIEGAYKRLCRKYHPDVNLSADSEERIKLINLAYDTLHDQRKRAAYDIEWRKRASSDPEQTTQSGVKYSRPHRSADFGSEESSRVISSFFLSLTSFLYDDAYALLTRTDQKRVSTEQFVKWRRKVETNFRVESYRILSSKYFDEFMLDDEIICPARRYAVEICEHNVKNDRQVKYIIYKFAVYEGGRWRVYLGYRDLSAITEHMADTGTKADSSSSAVTLMQSQMPGVLSYQQFMRSAESEMNRYKRYRRPFVLGVIQINIDARTSGPSATEPVLVVVGCALRRELRDLDCVSYFGENLFCVLLPETNKTGAKKLCGRLSRNIPANARQLYDSRVQLVFEMREYREGSVSNLLDSSISAIAKKSIDIS